MKKLTLTVVTVLALMASSAHAQRIQQKLGRAVVAVTDNSKSSVLVSWRKLAQEPENCTYNIYVRANGSTDYTKVNSEPVSSTNYTTDRSTVPYDSEIAVTMVSPSGVESDKSNPFLFQKRSYRDAFFEFDFDNTVLAPNNYRTTYVWPMDISGNGVVDAILVDRKYNGGETDPNCTTTSSKLQAYTLEGKLLWTVDMGPNVPIDVGQNDMVVAYDINCDGRCEVIIKSSDMTRFWDSKNNTWGKYANHSDVADTDGDGIEDYTQQQVKNPPFYVSVIDGQTGEELDCSELNYSEVHDGEDQYSRDNRTDYMDDSNGTEYAFMGGHFAICYFDGIHPSLAMECLDRTKDPQKHHNYVFAWSYDWNNGTPQNWHHSYTWSRNDKTPWPAEFHQLRVADVDGDGIDEMLQGGYGVNPQKDMVFSAGIEHGDRYDVSDIDPDRPGMETFAIQQSNLMGMVLYESATGKHLKEWYLPYVYDVGRGRCMDVDATHKGYEIFSTMGKLYDCHGDYIKKNSTYATEGIWWDGNLQRELISSPGGNGYNTNVHINTYGGTRLIQFSRESSWAVHATSGVRPAFMGDITGDWREEIILPKQASDKSIGLIGYSTDLATDYSLYTLQEDPHYRLDCTTRGYYQAPCTSFYLGSDMPYPPLPPTMVTDMRWSSATDWSAGSSAVSFDQKSNTAYADGKSVIFDITGSNASTINISSAIAPSAVYLMNPVGHDYTFAGYGSLTGTMELWKSMQGKATFNNVNFAFTGQTVVSEGTLEVNGTISGPVSLRAKGTLAGTPTINGDVTFEGALNYEGCRLMPGNDSDKYGTMTFGKSLSINKNAYIEVSAAEGNAGKILVNGDLTIADSTTFTINRVGDTLKPATYTLAECTGTLTADLAKIATRGLEGVNFDIKIDGKKIVLVVNETRAATKNVAWTGNESQTWDYKANNFSTDGNATYFVADDEVTFTDESSKRDITVNSDIVLGGMTFDFNNGTYSLSGSGKISGKGGLTKSGEGTLEISLRKNEFTGATTLNGGTLTINDLGDGGMVSPIGAAPADEGYLNLNGGILNVDVENVATDRIITLGGTATINLPNAKSAMSLKGIVKGDGTLVKDGPGQLNFTYAGENPFAAIVVKGGIIAQGAWNSTFGKSGSPMTLAGGTVNLIENNNSTTRPIFDNDATVVEGTENTINGTTRGAINGKFSGKGTLTIVSEGVRSDIGSDFSNFEGKLIAKGGNFRLMETVTDMSKASVTLESGCTMSHYASNSSTQKSATMKIGSIASTSTDCSLGHTKDNFEIGYNNESTLFAGKIPAKTTTKVGTGTLTMTNPETKTALTINEGTVCGTSSTRQLTIGNGGTLAVGLEGEYGSFKVTGKAQMNEGGTLAIDIASASVHDTLTVGGALTHNGETILLNVDGATLNVGDEIQIITAKSQSGTFTLKSSDESVTFDTTKLLESGIVKVTSASGIYSVKADDNTLVDVYSLDGRKLRHNVIRSKALEGLDKGIYLVDGKKVINK